MTSRFIGHTRQRRSLWRRWRAGVVVPALALIATMVGLPAQSALAYDVTQPTLVSADPANWTPQVLNGSVHALAVSGNVVIAGGTFTQVQDAKKLQPPVNRTNLFASDATTGAINTTFAPTTNGQVEALVTSADGQSVYVGGVFSQVNGVAAYSLAKVRLADGTLDPTFKPKRLNGRVFTMALANNKLYIGGSFANVGALAIGRVAALNPITGATDTSFNVPFAGVHRAGTTSVQKFDITPDGTRMLAIGNFLTVGGLDRDQAVMIDLTGPIPTVANWQTDRFKAQCSSSFNSYMHDVGFSPDGAYFVIGTTGAYFANTLCDASSRWETGATGNGLQPTWINYTGGDTIWSVAITGTAVYLGGHFRWQNNPLGANRLGPGAVTRHGLAALDPKTGLPLDWNPGRELGVGVFDLLPTPTGLWVGMDTDLIAGEIHSKFAFFPLAGGNSVPNPGAGTLPSNVYQIGQAGGQVGSKILYRVNAGGPSVKATESGNSAPDWAADDDGNPSPFHNAGSTTHSTNDSVNLSGVPSTTPSGLFKDNRIDPAGDPEMTWNFPVPAGMPVEVRLYFANIDNAASGARVFNVIVDGTVFLLEYDIRREQGNRVAGMRTWHVNSDGSVEITLRHRIGDPTIAGIEILKTCGAQDALTAADTITARSFNGTTAGPATPVVTTGQAWSQARGAFMLAGSLYTGWSDGKICTQSFDGSTIGTPQPVNYYGSNFGNDLRTLSAMFYAHNRIFYTLPGQSSLFWRWFTPQNNMIGSTAFVASPNVTGIDFSVVGGMMLNGTKLYYTQWNNGLLRRIDWNLDTRAPVAGTQITLGGSGVDGIDWRQQGLTMFAPAGAVAPNVAPRASWAANCNQLACIFSSAGSGDDDGTVASYSWNFGDGSTSTLRTPSHTYAAQGTYNVTLTVTDNVGAPGSRTAPLTVTVPPKPPVASFTASCIQLMCNVNGSASSDPDGTISSYAWNFGDDETTTGNPTSHTYDEAGTYTITLTVTDNSGMTGSTTRQVTVVEPASEISFIGSAQVNGGGSSPTVNVPASVAGGDGLLLMMVQNNTALTPATPAGWSKLSSAVKGSNLTTVWRNVASSSDAGAAVTPTVAGAGSGFRSAVTLLAYRGTSTVDPVSAFASALEGATATTSHVTPTVTVPANGSWVVSLWTDKTSTTTSITPPGSVTQRSATCGTDGGRVCLLASDGNGPVGAGSTAGGLTATASAAGTADTMWTIVLALD